MKRKRSKHIEPDLTVQSRLLIIQTAILCLIVFLSPLIAGRLTAIPALSMQLLILLCTLIWTIRAVKQGYIDLPAHKIVLILGVFFCLLVISVFDTASLESTLRELANIGCYLLVFMMVAGLRENRSIIYGILASLVISTIMIGAIGLKGYVLSGMPGWRTFSTFFNPDYLAGFMALMLPVILAWYLSKAPVSVSVISGLALLFAFANILMSGSRLGAIAAIGGILVFMVLALVSRSIKKNQFLRLLVIIIPAFIVFLTLSKPLANRVASIKAESYSGGFRIYTWNGTARMAAANPINGTGLGTFEITYPRYALVGFTKMAHNSYLQLAGEAGPAAAVMLIVLLAASILPPTITLIRKHKENESPVSDEQSWMPETNLMLCGLIGGAAASAARNVVDSDWYVTAIGISFWAVMGSVVALGHQQKPNRIQWSSRRFALSTMVIALMSIGLLLMLASELYFAKGSALWADQDPERAVDSYKIATRLDPLNAEYHRRLGNVYMMFARELGEELYAGLAEDELRKAVKLEPSSAKTYYQLGRIYEFYPRNDAAIRMFQEAIKRHPSAPELLCALAQRYEKAGRHMEAMRTWEKIIQVEGSPYTKVRAVPELVEPEYTFAHMALGQEFEQNGDKSGAVKEYRLALNWAKSYLDSMKAMGKVLEVTGMRNVEMEDQMDAIRDDLVQRLENLER